MPAVHPQVIAARALRSERGFALPFTIFLVTIITIMLAAAFTRATADHMIASNSATEVSALTVAQSGLQAFMQAGDTMSARPAPSDSFRFNVTGGYAWVYPELIFQPPDTALGFTYIVRSVGNVIHPSVGPDPQATRTIAQFARWRGGTMPGIATLVALNGVSHSNNSTHLPLAMWFDGDEVTCGPPYSPAAGAVLGYRGPSDQGNDPGQHADPSSLGWEAIGSAADIGDELGIDWTAATTDSILDPDYTNLVSDPDFPTFLLQGNRTLDVSGTGLLVVTGNLSLLGNVNIQWDGLILVGGEIVPVVSAGGTTVIHGMVVTGLNRLQGSDVDPNPMGVDSPAFELYYSSCSVRRALERFSGFHTIDNAWVDNWATY